MKKIKDLKGNPLLLFINAWSVGMTLERNEGLVLIRIWQEWTETVKCEGGLNAEMTENPYGGS